VLEAREPPGDVTLHAPAPALPEPKPEPTEVERLGGQLAQCDADRAATGAVSPEENPWSEVVSVRSQAANHRPQQLFGKMLQCPPRSIGSRSADTERWCDKNRTTNRDVGADAQSLSHRRLFILRVIHFNVLNVIE
jgi:hypothetical protein